jgi:hypothetical protein
MLKNTSKLKKNRDRLNLISYFLIVISTFFLLLNCISVFNSNANVMAGSNSYIPAPPTGNNSGYVGIDYEYVIKTMDVGAFWIFDWGDGTYSNWIKLDESDASVSQYHSWKSPGIYEIKVKHRDIYGAESSWSPPLSVNTIFDSDEDGWSDESELLYGTGPNSASDYPKDTDQDGTPDVVDLDDDNDGLSDVIEIQLGSDPKNSQDAKEMRISGVKHYLIDTTKDGKSDLFYNTISGVNTTLEITKSGLYLIDFNGDHRGDYTYNLAQGAIEPYEEQKSFEFPWLWAITVIAVVAIITIIILFKKGILYLYDEYVVEK